MQTIAWKIPKAKDTDSFPISPIDNFHIFLGDLLDQKMDSCGLNNFNGPINFVINQDGIRNREVSNELKKWFRSEISTLHDFIPSLPNPFSGRMEILVAQNVPKEVRFIPIN